MKFQFSGKNLIHDEGHSETADNDVTPHPLAMNIFSSSPSLSNQTLQTNLRVIHDTGICIAEFFPLNLFANKIKFDGV